MLIKGGGITPDAKILHIVRDVRDVMSSLREQKWVADIDLYFPRVWSNANLYLHALYQDKPAHYLLVRYEDLVAQPEAGFAKVCEHLGVQLQPEMLKPESRHARYKSMPHHARLYEPISTARIGRYKELLDPNAIASYETQAGEALRVFGYASGVSHS
jgi:hypothetical protein